jgi:hypothetical protein
VDQRLVDDLYSLLSGCRRRNHDKTIAFISQLLSERPSLGTELLTLDNPAGGLYTHSNRDKPCEELTEQCDSSFVLFILLYRCACVENFLRALC